MKTLYNDNEVLTFRHLYDVTWGCLVIHNHDKWVVFPQDFQPEVGKKYEVTIQWTWFGTFNYKGKRYSVARAHLMGKAGIIEEIDYKYREKEKPESSMEIAMKNAFKKVGGQRCHYIY